ncbi:MAG: sarcosine oxidase subunit gamma [Sphingomonadaceae bacterium]
MAEALVARDVIAAEPFIGAGVTIALLPQRRRFALRGVASDLEAFVPGPLPGRIGDIAIGADGSALMLGPDEWLYLGDVAHSGSGAPVGIVDISDRQGAFALAGPRAAEVLMSGCPLDLDRLAPGRGTRTIYETVEIVVMKHAADRFEVEVWRSFAPWLHEALVQAARDLATV